MNNQYSSTTTELQIHYAVANLLRLMARPDIFWTHFPSGEDRSARIGAKLKYMGVKPGVADFLLFLPGGRIACLEVKGAKGRQSLEQRNFEASCKALGAPYAIARSLDEAEAILSEWGALRLREHFGEAA